MKKIKTYHITSHECLCKVKFTGCIFETLNLHKTNLKRSQKGIILMFSLSKPLVVIPGTSQWLLLLSHFNKPLWPITLKCNQTCHVQRYCYVLLHFWKVNSINMLINVSHSTILIKPYFFWRLTFMIPINSNEGSCGCNMQLKIHEVERKAENWLRKTSRTELI